MVTSRGGMLEEALSRISLLFGWMKSRVALQTEIQAFPSIVQRFYQVTHN
jgi:hypothetical protein